MDFQAAADSQNAATLTSGQPRRSLRHSIKLTVPSFAANGCTATRDRSTVAWAGLIFVRSKTGIAGGFSTLQTVKHLQQKIGAVSGWLPARAAKVNLHAAVLDAVSTRTFLPLRVDRGLPS